jgi:hypothetical protein
MSKVLITRLFIAALVALVGGFVLVLIGLLAALSGAIITIGGPEVVTINGGSFAWALAILIIGSLAITVGGILGIVSWIGALFNTAQLEDKTWFAVLLVLGLFSFGWIAMIAYIFAGPDGTTYRAPAPIGTAQGI